VPGSCDVEAITIFLHASTRLKALFASDVGAIRVLPPRQLDLNDLSVVGVSNSWSDRQFYDPSHQSSPLH
jgi:hypothetical protein